MLVLHTLTVKVTVRVCEAAVSILRINSFDGSLIIEWEYVSFAKYPLLSTSIAVSDSSSDRRDRGSTADQEAPHALSDQRCLADGPAQARLRLRINFSTEITGRMIAPASALTRSDWAVSGKVEKIACMGGA